MEKCFNIVFLLWPNSTVMFFLSLQMSKEWETVVCGQTKDQLIMTEKARRYLRSLKSHAPNRALILSWDISHLFNMLHTHRAQCCCFPLTFCCWWWRKEHVMCRFSTVWKSVKTLTTYSPINNLGEHGAFGFILSPMALCMASKLTNRISLYCCYLKCVWKEQWM